MTAVIQKWGNSLAVRLPKAVANQIQVSEGNKLEMLVEGSTLILRAASRKYTLAELLRKVTAENQHHEVDWGKAEGKEGW